MRGEFMYPPEKHAELRESPGQDTERTSQI